MSEPTTLSRLVIGTKRYSSWSLRGWLAVHLARLPVEEVVIPLAGGTTEAVKAATPAGFVPYLEHEGARVWESLAICEYCAELSPNLWPAERRLRALLRSAATEMHGGFRGIRGAMSFNIGREWPGAGRTAEALDDIARIEAIWAECLAATGGPFLHGAEMGVADCMYAPVALRFLTYRPEISAASEGYVQAVRAHPLIARWYEEAAAEPAAWQLPKFEADPAA